MSRRVDSYHCNHLKHVCHEQALATSADLIYGKLAVSKLCDLTLRTIPSTGLVCSRVVRVAIHRQEWRADEVHCTACDGEWFV